MLRHPAVTSAIIGPRTADHLGSQLGAVGIALTDDVLDQIDSIVTPGYQLPVGRRRVQPTGRRRQGSPAAADR